MEKPLLIVGIDPGTTLGYALVDIQGNLVHIGSERVHSLSDLTKEIISHGQILIVASDKKKTPEFVERFAVKTGARLLKPDHDLLQSEKKDLVKDHKGNSHEMDALASAFYAYKANKGLLDKGLRFIQRTKAPQEVISLVIRSGINFREAHDLLREDTQIKPMQEIAIKEIEEQPTRSSGTIKLFNTISTLTERVSHLEKELNRLREERAQLIKANKDLQSRMRKEQQEAAKEKTYRLKDQKISLLNKEKRILKEKVRRRSTSEKDLISLLHRLKDNYLAIRLKDLKASNLEQAKDFKMIYVDDASVYTEKALPMLQKRHIISDSKFPARIRNEPGIHCIEARRVRFLHKRGRFAVIKKESFDALKTDAFEKLIKDYKRSRA